MEVYPCARLQWQRTKQRGRLGMDRRRGLRGRGVCFVPLCFILKINEHLLTMKCTIEAKFNAKLFETSLILSRCLISSFTFYSKVDDQMIKEIQYFRTNMLRFSTKQAWTTPLIQWISYLFFCLSIYRGRAGGENECEYEAPDPCVEAEDLTYMSITSLITPADLRDLVKDLK